MSNFRIPGPLCQEVQDNQKVQGSPSDQDLIGYLDAFSYEALESSVKNLSSFIPVQVDSVSLNKLKKKKDKSFGLNVALVQVFGNPAIVEFNVKMWRTYYGLGSIKRKTGEIDTSPTYLNGTSRGHQIQNLSVETVSLKNHKNPDRTESFSALRHLF